MDKQSQLQRLSQLQFNTEDDVREEFVTPLLQLLGYDHIRGEIERGHSLSTPYQSGTKRKEYVIPDYLTHFEDVVHLATDAKGPGTSIEQAKRIVTDKAYIGQVHSYAAHREVQAPFFVITNGQFTAVYETTKTDFQPVLLISQYEIGDRFQELEDLVSKRSIAHLLLHRLPLAWKVPIMHREVGYQPMNLAVGDINQDGVPEIAIALSENHIPIVNHKGVPIATIETDGWVWWVKCTGAQGDNEATLVAIQKDRGPRDTTGKLLGINGSRLVWEHHLPRAGSGFEHLDRIVVDSTKGAIVFGVACDNVITSVAFQGEVLWTTRLTTEKKWRSVMHVREFRDGRSVLVTSGVGAGRGIIAELDTWDGRVRQTVDLPFRGAKIEILDNVSQKLAIASCDSAQLAIVDWGAANVVSVIDLPINGRPRLAVDSERELMAISGMNHLQCYSISDVGPTLPAPAWETEDVRGYINRLLWIKTSQKRRLLASTSGTAASPRYNGMYLITANGEIDARYYLTSTPVNPEYGLSGIRDVKPANISRLSDPDIIAISDDSHLYVWNPSY